ncbi:MAG: oxygenase MpaB family protein [Solirubrobacterales bacterium]
MSGVPSPKPTALGTKPARISNSGDRGYFPDGESVLREVHGERIVGLYYGQRTTLVGALDALLYEGTERHTRGKSQPWARLARTARIMENVFFGTREDADKELARVAAMHKKVKGTIPASADPRISGKRYSAFTPELAYRTIGAMADSALAVYEACVRELNDNERETYWQEYLYAGELFGLDVERPVVPNTYEQFREDWDAWLHDPKLFLTPGARESAIQSAFHQPLPRPQEELQKRLNHLIVTGTLPDRVREIYGLDWGFKDRLAFRAMTKSLKTSRPVTPRQIRRGRNHAQFNLVARTEHFRQERGRETWQIPA